MKQRKFCWFGVTLILLFFSLACSLLSGSAEPAAAPSATSNQESTAAATLPISATESSRDVLQSSGYESEFPLPGDVRDFKELLEGQINYQTSMTLEEISDFYRAEFVKRGLKERTLLTLLNEKSLSIVFEGSANGKLIVVQAVPLSPEIRNVNVRYE